MARVEECLKALKTAVLESEEYQRFLKSSERLSEYPEKMRQTNEYRSRNYILQNSSDNGRVFEEIDNFAEEFMEFRKDPMVDEFLISELQVCRMIQEIYYEIAEGIDFQMDIPDLKSLQR